MCLLVFNICVCLSNSVNIYSKNKFYLFKLHDKWNIEAFPAMKVKINKNITTIDANRPSKTSN